jgi:D-cysteine desulfhydrase family pyridoxal phosphate-dependent enzyme
LNIAHLPRVRLSHLPTPLEEAPALSAALGGPRIVVKRDDMTGLALGGNKARKLEYLLGAAKAAGATAVLTTAGVNSNYLRMTAAGARKAGLRPVLFMRGTGDEPVQGNVLLNHIVGAEMRYITIADPWSPETEQLMQAHARELASRGERAFVITVQTTHAPLAAIGYVNAALELYQQLLDRDSHATTIFTPTGSGVTQAGLILGAKLMHWPLQVVGLAGSPNSAAAHRERIADIVARAAHLLGARVNLSPDEIIVEDDYAGESYGKATPGVIRAIQLAGETEGMLLDPVYSGKTMHGLIDWIERGRLSPQDTVVFLHSGGAPNLFTQAEHLGPALKELRARQEA